MVAIVSDSGQVCGVFTDGDLRRTIASDIDFRKARINSVMTSNPATTTKEALAVNAVAKMQELKITALPVVNDGQLEGVVTMHALLAAGVV